MRPADAVPPELVHRLRQHKADLLAALPDSVPHRGGEWLGLRVFSRILGEHVWLVVDEADAATLEVELAAEGEPALIAFTLDEVTPLAGMLEADRRALLGALVKVKRAMPGATLEGVTVRTEGDEQ